MTEIAQMVATWIGYCILLAVVVTVVGVFIKFILDRVHVARFCSKQSKNIDLLRDSIRTALKQEGTDQLSHDVAWGLREAWHATDPIPEYRSDPGAESGEKAP